MLAYVLELSHVHFLFGVVFTLFGRLAPGSDLLVCSWWLVFAGCYYYFASNNQLWQCTKIEGTSSLPLGRLLGRDGQYFRHNMNIYILHLRHKDTILTILCIGLRKPITNTLAGEWLNNLIFHDDIKCITTNG